MLTPTKLEFTELEMEYLRLRLTDLADICEWAQPPDCIDGPKDLAWMLKKNIEVYTSIQETFVDPYMKEES